MQLVNEHYGTGSTLDSLQGELQYLTETFGPFLKQESLQGDISCLTDWIVSYQSGDVNAGEYLQEHGRNLLENIKLKLQAAVKEMQRIDEESPSGENFTGGKVDRLNKAAKSVIRAEQQLEKAIADEINV